MIATVHSPIANLPPIETEADRVVAVAEAQLRKCHYLPLREVMCQFHEGVLVLYGRVPTFYLKQVAQTVVRSVEGVVHIDNRLEVD